MRKVGISEQAYILLSDLNRVQTMLYCLRQIIKKNSEYITATEYDTVANILVTWERLAYQKIKILEKAEE